MTTQAELKEYAYKILRNSQGLEQLPDNEKLQDEKNKLISQFDTIVTNRVISKCTPRVYNWLRIYFSDKLEEI